MSIKIVNITDIDWDTSDYTGPDDDLREIAPTDLPSEINGVEIDCWKPGDDLAELVSEWLSDNYGYNVNGFNYEVA